LKSMYWCSAVVSICFVIDFFCVSLFLYLYLIFVLCCYLCFILFLFLFSSLFFFAISSLFHKNVCKYGKRLLRGSSKMYYDGKISFSGGRVERRTLCNWSFSATLLRKVCRYQTGNQKQQIEGQTNGKIYNWKKV